jgi:hypothetical protein
MLNLGKDSGNRKNVNEKMKKGKIAAAEADGSVIMQWEWQRKCVISSFSHLVVASRTLGLVLCHET